MAGLRVMEGAFPEPSYLPNAGRWPVLTLSG
jgi:hypothetical protein